jgi:PAS domain S-box-containing protein
MKFNKAFRYTSAFVLIGILLVFLVTYVERNTLSTYQRNLPYINLGDNLKNRITKGHLWFEEAMAGDNSISFENDVLKLFQSSSQILQGAYDGQDTELGQFDADVDEETKAMIKQAINDVDKLIIASKDRWKFKNQAAAVTDSAATSAGEQAGGLLDQQFDATYEQTQVTLDKLIDHVSKNVKSDSTYLSALSWISVGLIAVVIAVVSIFLYRFQFNNDKMVAEGTRKLDEESRRVNTLTDFIQAVSSGDYSIELTSTGEGDNLTKTLVDMRDKLRDNADEDRKRNWSTSGVAQIGEILRSTSGTSRDLYDKIIQFVVKYTKSNQGGLFIFNDDNENDHFLELVSAYAYERKKFLEKRVGTTEGLIGQCYLEGARIYLMEIPEEYVNITSGLGGSVPTSLLLVPMKVNDRIYGVIELASFNKYEEYQIEVVEKFAESIGSTISSVKISESTKVLLEKTQQQAEEMRAQEEEMRQNMEELEATQEEMRRKEKHIQNMLDDEKMRNVFKESNSKKLAELTKNHDIQAGHWDKALEILTSSIAAQLQSGRCGVWLYDGTGRLTAEKVYTRDKNKYESGEEMTSRDYPSYFAELRKERELVMSDAHGHPVTREMSGNYLQVHNIESKVDVPVFSEAKIVAVITCEQVSERKEWNEDHLNFLKACADLVSVAYKGMKMNQLLSQLHNSQDTLQAIIDNIPRAIFWKDAELRFQGCNKIFSDIAGLRSPREIAGKTDFEMPWKQHAELYRKDDRDVMLQNKAKLNIEEKNTDSDGTESWVLTSKVPIGDEHGRIIAVLGMFEDITQRKRKEADVAKKLQELEQLKKLMESRQG